MKEANVRYRYQVTVEMVADAADPADSKAMFESLDDALDRLREVGAISVELIEKEDVNP